MDGRLQELKRDSSWVFKPKSWSGWPNPRGSPQPFPGPGKSRKFPALFFRRFLSSKTSVLDHFCHFSGSCPSGQILAPGGSSFSGFGPWGSGFSGFGAWGFEFFGARRLGSHVFRRSALGGSGFSARGAWGFEFFAAWRLGVKICFARRLGFLQAAFPCVRQHRQGR